MSFSQCRLSGSPFRDTVQGRADQWSSSVHQWKAVLTGAKVKVCVWGVGGWLDSGRWRQTDWKFNRVLCWTNQVDMQVTLSLGLKIKREEIVIIIVWAGFYRGACLFFFLFFFFLLYSLLECLWLHNRSLTFSSPRSRPIRARTATVLLSAARVLLNHSTPPTTHNSRWHRPSGIFSATTIQSRSRSTSAVRRQPRPHIQPTLTTGHSAFASTQGCFARTCSKS